MGQFIWHNGDMEVNMLLPAIFSTLGETLKKDQIAQILKANEESEKYGLKLLPAEAEEVVVARNRLLQTYGRIELDVSVTAKFIQTFCSSPFINQKDYVITLLELHEVFYYLKSETEDKIGDDELITAIKGMFEESSRGSIELLKGRELEAFIQNFKTSNF